MGNRAVAVRSSATTEDAADASFAGLQDTYLWVTDLEQTLQQRAQLLGQACIRSNRSATGASVALPEEGVAMAVVVQNMVDARTAGVMFTRSPLDRRSLGDHHRGLVGPGLGGGGRGSHAGSLGASARSPARSRVRDISDKPIQHVPRVNGRHRDCCRWRSACGALACMSDEELQTSAGDRPQGRAALRPAAGYRMGGGARRRTRFCCCRAGRRRFGQRRSRRRSHVAATDPSTHVMSIFGGNR